MATALQTLDGPNTEAWALYRKVITRLTGDLGAGGMVLERLTRDLSSADFEDVWRRLSILYHAICPMPEPPKES